MLSHLAPTRRSMIWRFVCFVSGEHNLVCSVRKVFFGLKRPKLEKCDKDISSGSWRFITCYLGHCDVRRPVAVAWSEMGKIKWKMKESFNESLPPSYEEVSICSA